MQARDLLRQLLSTSLVKTAATRRTSKKVVDSDAVLGKLAKLHKNPKDPKCST